MSERFYYWNPMSIDRYDLVVNTGVLDLERLLMSSSRRTRPRPRGPLNPPHDAGRAERMD